MTAELPDYLRPLHSSKVVICDKHQNSYTQLTLDNHLRRDHGLQKAARERILSWIPLSSLASTPEEVIHPRDGIAPISALHTYEGYICHLDNCNHRSVSSVTMRQHYNKEHRIYESKHGLIPWHRVNLQALFVKPELRRYFAVVPPDQLVNGETDSQQYIFPRDSIKKSRAGLPQLPLVNTSPSKQGLCDAQEADHRVRLLQDYTAAQNAQDQHFRTLATPAHVSEVTPWLKITGFHVHLANIELEELPSAWNLPDADQEPLLHAICAGMERVLESAMRVLPEDYNKESRQLSRVNARVLNTFMRGETSSDPIFPLQNRRTQKRYITCWQQLICYYCRVGELGYLSKDLFSPTDLQRRRWQEMIDAAEELRAHQSKTQGRTSEVSHSHETSEEAFFGTSHDPEEEGGMAYQRDVDDACLQFSLSIIQHPLTQRRFDSVLVSFAAALGWNPRTRTWLEVGNYTGFLSQLIYDCQMIILAESLRRSADDTQALGLAIRSLRDRWLLNHNEAPVTELLENRVLGFKIAREDVPPAQIRWHADGRTVVHGEHILHIRDLHTLIWESIREARQILTEDLCLGLTDLPQFAIGDLVDDWNAKRPGGSFLTDTRNDHILAPARQWLMNEICRCPARIRHLLERGADGRWGVQTEVAKQYEYANQRFLDALTTPFLLGSGQLARRPEFLSLRWANNSMQSRNLFIHDGRMLFILTYHKSINITNASRWPARFLLPEVADLVVQYLTLIQPFRTWMSHSTSIPEKISEYLWSYAKGVWPEERLTENVCSAGRRWIGQGINLRSWRQLTIGIAVRKFAGLGHIWATLADAPGSVEDEEHEDEGSIPSVFHWQAAHNPHTGNRVYGGTVNFRSGLTDAGLQEFRKASDIWHSFCRDPLGFNPDHPLETQPVDLRRSRKRHRHDDQSLPHRLTRRRVFQQRQWTKEAAHTVLQRMYGTNARYRTSHQEQAMSHVIEGAAQVVAVLRTGEGKSLLYLLPCQLPGAGTTVVILSLTALIQDITYRCTQFGIEAQTWNEEINIEETRCPLLLVGVEQATNRHFRKILNRLHMAGTLDRVVFDECHLILTAARYRPVMGLVYELRRISCQFVYLTGTLPPCMTKEFEQAVLLQGSRLVRNSTARADLTYRVVEIPAGESLVGTFTADLIRARTRFHSAAFRAIVYTRTRSQAESLSGTLNCPTYYSDSGSAQEKAEVFRAWRAGECHTVVATGAFGAGVDCSAVRLVVHVGPPDSMIDFAQETGRLGRDGKGGLSYVLLPAGWQPGSDREVDPLLSPAHRAMQEFLNEPRCRLDCLSRFLDNERQSCGSDLGLCDRCEALGPDESPPGSDHQESGNGSVSSGPASESDSVDAELAVGPRLVEDRVRSEEIRLRAFRDNLVTFQGICVICRLLPHGTAHADSRHTLTQCRNPARIHFFAAKREAMRRGRAGSGWIQQYAACYRCFNPQSICERQGQQGCEFPDLVLPTCWAAFQREMWVELELNDITDQTFSDDVEFLLWLGRRREVYGITASNGMYIADHVLRTLAA